MKITNVFLFSFLTLILTFSTIQFADANFSHRSFDEKRSQHCSDLYPIYKTLGHNEFKKMFIQDSMALSCLIETEKVVTDENSNVVKSKHFSYLGESFWALNNYNILINYVPSETVSVAPIIDKFSTTSSDHNSINDSAIIYEEIKHEKISLKSYDDNISRNFDRNFINKELPKFIPRESEFSSDFKTMIDSARNAPAFTESKFISNQFTNTYDFRENSAFSYNYGRDIFLSEKYPSIGNIPSPLRPWN